MTALIIMTGIVGTVAVVMFGIYKCAGITNHLTVQLRNSEDRYTTAARDNAALREQVNKLKVELQTEKNRKVYTRDSI